MRPDYCECFFFSLESFVSVARLTLPQGYGLEWNWKHPLGKMTGQLEESRTLSVFPNMVS